MSPQWYLQPARRLEGLTWLATSSSDITSFMWSALGRKEHNIAVIPWIFKNQKMNTNVFSHISPNTHTDTQTHSHTQTDNTLMATIINGVHLHSPGGSVPSLPALSGQGQMTLDPLGVFHYFLSEVCHAPRSPNWDLVKEIINQQEALVCPVCNFSVVVVVD